MDSCNGETPLNASDPANLKDLKKILQEIPVPPTWLWALLTILIRYIMTEARLDRRSAGVQGLVFSTLTPPQLTFRTDRKWSESLGKIDQSKPELVFGRNTKVPKWSIRRHSWWCFEYWVDCISFKKHIVLQENIRGEDGLITNWIQRRRRSMYKMLSGNSYDSYPVPTRCPLKRVEGVTFNNLILAYGDHEVVVPAGAGNEAQFWAERLDICVSTIIRFILFGWGLLYCSKIAACAVTAPLVVLTLIFWGFCCRLPETGEAWDFCQRISHDADRIHEAGNQVFLDGSTRDTIDVVLYLDVQDRWTWCRIGRSWISYMIPMKRPWAEYAFSILSLLAHTLLPIGWINETNFVPNFVFALITASMQYLYPTLGPFYGILIATALHSLAMQPELTGDWWILSYYVFLHELFSRGYNLGPMIDWIYEVFVHIRDTLFPKKE